MEQFLSRLPPDGRVLDAACGTGKYFPMVLASARRLLGVDHAGAPWPDHATITRTMRLPRNSRPITCS